MRRKGIGAVAVGAVLLIAAVVGFVVVPEHQPRSNTEQVAGGQVVGQCVGTQVGGPYTYNGIPCHDVTTTSGPSRTLYDAMKVATWALAIVGILLATMGLIRYARPEVAR